MFTLKLAVLLVIVTIFLTVIMNILEKLRTVILYELNLIVVVFLQVFLHHLTPLQSLTTFTALWLTILDFMDKYMHADKSDLLVST
jgi:brefeldin A-resistance guanine nucleotide exchange factor 1